MNEHIKIGMLIVTYNRIDKLKKTLLSIESQTRTPDLVFFVDNSSTDGTDMLLSSWCQKVSFKTIVYRTSENLGGAGGFSIGLDLISKENIDWIYIGDDDAYPNRNTLQEFEKKTMSFNSNDNIVALASKVVDKDGISLEHRRTIKKVIF